MANTTFNGPVRSENGFETITKNATTGAVTITSGNKMAVEAATAAGIEGTAAVYVTQVERFKSDTTTNVNIVKIQQRREISLVKMVMVLLTLGRLLLLTQVQFLVSL